MIRRHRLGLRPRFDSLDDRCLLAGLTPQQVTHAYGLDAIKSAAGTQAVVGNGSGQTIAVVVAYHDSNLAADLSTFDRAYGLASPSLTQVDQAGNSSDDGWASEETLDVEWAHAIAPGANIVVVEARSAGFQDMIAAIATARGLPGVSVVSMSWGMGEFRGETAYDSLFTTPAGHTAITFVSASGDSGSAAGAEWPSSSPNVLSVGGTSLFVGAGGTYAGESTWSGGGGGYSRFEGEPGYQAGVQSSGRRSTPDVAFDANPATGVSVYVTSPSTGVGSWQVYGGTSVGTPAWAAIIAIADQGRAAAGLGTLSGATQTLPALYSLPSGDFHKGGTLTTTGLGSPNGASLVRDLALGAANTGTSAVVLASTTTTTSQSTTPVGSGRHRRYRHTFAAAATVVLQHPSSLSRFLDAVDAALGEPLPPPFASIGMGM